MLYYTCENVRIGDHQIVSHVVEKYGRGEARASILEGHFSMTAAEGKRLTYQDLSAWSQFL